MPTVLRPDSHLLIGRDHTGVTLTTVHGTGAQIHGIIPESGGTDGIGATHGTGDVRDIIGHGIMTRGIMILGITITTTIIIGAATIITAMEEGTCIGATEARPPATAAATSWA